MANTATQENDYFRYPGILFRILVPFMLVILTIMNFQPSLLPLDHLGPVFTFFGTRPALVKFIFWSTVIVHIGEAVYAYNLAKKKGMSDATAFRWSKWVFFYGLFIMKYLIAYEPKQKSS